jgi:hypothetical protein
MSLSRNSQHRLGWSEGIWLQPSPCIYDSGNVLAQVCIIIVISRRWRFRRPYIFIAYRMFSPMQGALLGVGCWCMHALNNAIKVSKEIWRNVQEEPVSEGAFWISEGTRFSSAGSIEYNPYPTAILQIKVKGLRISIVVVHLPCFVPRDRQR